jgi:divalent metal cation (Fe/Co/Zn/Cd) transporter
MKSYFSSTAGIASVSVLVGVVVLALKYYAYYVTGSVALYSDALESVINVATALAAILAIWIADFPPDDEHPYGHHKAEYFSVVTEGVLIIVAAVLIFNEAYHAWLSPRLLEEPGVGFAFNGAATLLNGFWAAVLVLPRTYDPDTGTYGNLYSNLLDYVVSAALIFYILTIAGVFRLRRTRPGVERPYRAFGYPVLPAMYIAGAAAILIALFAYRTATTWPGLIIVLLGVPVYFAWKPRA